jgi:hypothetical protein
MPGRRKEVNLKKHTVNTILFKKLHDASGKKACWMKKEVPVPFSY